MVCPDSIGENVFLLQHMQFAQSVETIGGEDCYTLEPGIPWVRGREVSVGRLYQSSHNRPTNRDLGPSSTPGSESAMNFGGSNSCEDVGMLISQSANRGRECLRL